MRPAFGSIVCTWPLGTLADAVTPLRRVGACPTGKTPHPSRHDAQLALEYLVRKSVRHAADSGRKFPARVYECPTCTAWHLTSRA